MTAVRPENAAGGPQGRPAYEDTAEFAAAVDRLADPLNDPLPGRTPPAAPAPPADGSPWPPQQTQPPGQSSFGPGHGYDVPAAPRPRRPEPSRQVPPPATPPAPGSRAVRRHAAQTGSPTGIPPHAERDDDPPTGPADGGRAARRRAAAHAHSAGTEGPVPGGRAARRKAARRGGHRAGPHSGEQAAPDTAATPRTRLEARRAARAAKPSTGVVVSGLVGEAFITLGVLMLLFVAYQLWWTNVLAHEAAGSAASNLQHQWDGEHSTNDARNPGAFSPGQGFAIIYIPKLDVKAPIAEGIDKHAVLDKGMVGHYSGAQETAMPWAKTGNFALAGHRNTHGEPFRYINKLVPGDKVVVETESTFYTYAVTGMLPQTSPSNVSVIQPIPAGSGFTKPGRYITLTTCTPEFTSTYRLIVWGKMVDERPRSQGKPDALVQ